MNYLILGSSAGLGRSLAERLAKDGHHLFLIASDKRDLSAQCADLELRYSIRAHFIPVHISSASNWSTRIIEEAEKFGKLDGLFFPIGAALPKDNGFLDENSTRQTLEINFSCVTTLVSFFLPALIKEQSGVIVGFGSIASLRGRKGNIIYSAAKRALESYFESIRHLAAGTSLRVQFYQIGYLETQQTYGKKLLFPKLLPEIAADHVVRNLKLDFGHRFLPSFWFWISFALKRVPWVIYKRLNF